MILRTIRAAISLVAIALTAWAVIPAWTARAIPLRAQPYPDSLEYADAARQLADGHGYMIAFDERHRSLAQGPKRFPPRYPPGTSLALAPFHFLGDHFPGDVQSGSRTISSIYVVLIVGAAWCMGGPLSAAIAALFVGVSPFARVSATLILSDQLAALLTVAGLLAVILASRWRRAGSAVAGAVSGFLVVVRLTGVVGLVAVLASVSRRRLALACAAPFVIGLGIYQWLTFGSPLRTGYAYWLPGLHNFELSYVVHPLLREGPFVYPDKLNGGILSSVCPCGIGGPIAQLPDYTFYPAVLLGFFWIFAPPFTAVIGLVYAIRERATPAARYTLVTVVLSLVILIPYFYQAARFVAPAASLLLVYSATGIAALVSSITRRLVSALRFGIGGWGSELG